MLHTLHLIDSLSSPPMVFTSWQAGFHVPQITANIWNPFSLTRLDIMPLNKGRWPSQDQCWNSPRRNQVMEKPCWNSYLCWMHRQRCNISWPSAVGWRSWWGSITILCCHFPTDCCCTCDITLISPQKPAIGTVNSTQTGTHLANKKELCRKVMDIKPEPFSLENKHMTSAQLIATVYNAGEVRVLIMICYYVV